MSDPCFRERLRSVQLSTGTALCVGVDVDPRRLPEGLSRDRAGVQEFIRGIVEATSDAVCAYKPNLAFFEALGEEGLTLLRFTLQIIPDSALIIGDAKRGDISTTSERYAEGLFEGFGFDAVTVNPYLGFDGVEPFLRDPARGAFLLCRTSNPGARDFQDLVCDYDGMRLPLFEVVAHKASEWNTRGNVGLVAGATYPKELARIREIGPDLPLLVLGVGAQGADPATALCLGASRDGTLAIVSVSRQVLYASSGPDWAAAARKEALALGGVLGVRSPSEEA